MLLIMALAMGFVSQAFATLGSASNTPVPGVVDQMQNKAFGFGTISGTGSADTSTAILANGYKLAQFKVVKAAYRGTFKIQGSWDNSAWEDLNVTSLDASAVTETYYWQTNQGYPYLRITGDPNGSNAGTVAVTGRLVCFSDKTVENFTGYYGIHEGGQELLASALRTSATSTYCYVTGKGIQVDFNATATNSGSATISVWSVSPTGVATFKLASTAVTAVTTTVGNRTLIITPDIVTAANSTAVGSGNRWLITVDEGGTSTTYSLAVKPIPYNFNYRQPATADSN